MKLYSLQRAQRLPVGLEEAWQFFSSPFNLQKITPPWLNLKVVNPISAKMHAGMLIQYRVTPFLGLPVTWVSEITHTDPPRFFVDEQRMGPYHFWHHQHLLQPVGDATDVTDTVHYALKLGCLGRWAHRLLVRKRLQLIFDYRQSKLAQLFP